MLLIQGLWDHLALAFPMLSTYCTQYLTRLSTLNIVWGLWFFWKMVKHDQNTCIILFSYIISYNFSKNTSSPLWFICMWQRIFEIQTYWKIQKKNSFFLFSNFFFNVLSDFLIHKNFSMVISFLFYQFKGVHCKTNII